MTQIDTETGFEVEPEDYPHAADVVSDLLPSHRSQYARSLAHCSLVIPMWFNGLVDASTRCSNEIYSVTPVTGAISESYDVATYNLGQGEYGLEGVLDIIADQPQVDTTCLQEAPAQGLSRLKRASGLKNDAVNWNGRTAMFGEYGNVILTNDRIVESHVYNLPSHPDHPPRSLLATILEDSNGLRRVLFNTHLAAQNANLPHFGTTERVAQVVTILWNIRLQPQYRDLPFIMCADLNEKPDGNAYAIITEILGDTTDGVEEPLITLPEYWTQSDYIFSDQLVAREASVFGNDDSNHCRLAVRLFMRPPHQPYSNHAIYPEPR